MKAFLLVLMSLGFFTAAAFAQVAPETSTSKPSANSAIRDGNFVSESLGFSMAIPRTYTVHSAEETKVLTDAGMDLLKNKDADSKRIDAAAKRTTSLLLVSQRPYGEKPNGAIEVVAVPQKKGVTAAMSLAANVLVLKDTDYKLVRSLGATRLGSNVFHVADFKGTFAGTLLNHSMYVIMIKGHSVGFGLTYENPEQRTEMEAVVSTLKILK